MNRKKIAYYIIMVVGFLLLAHVFNTLEPETSVLLFNYLAISIIVMTLVLTLYLLMVKATQQKQKPKS